MSTEELATMLYLAMLNKPCACLKRWQKDQLVIAVQCGGCKAIDAYRASPLFTPESP